ncbi:YchJ family protein [Mycobacterium sp. ITM-2016-00318]|uniref:YchJ family protein n=1 Tax=Mycobacterium sp. ITM-2016-00318 TaxID=2099693 RepID=UPI000CF9AB8F|nr:YchJ family metal-binding protein [Mycobacterium sp. ITM-2016-00318]WNG94864.1 YchJ family metal-binding protein [Mycobacterium sp. ITM-2016-00318]
MSATDDCPCGGEERFCRCCRPLHAGERQASTAEELMRSRYCAYAVGDLDYLWRTWHPRTRPEALTPSDEVWTGLEILDVVAGQQGDDEGEVEFLAHYLLNRRSGTLRERSHFAARARRWFYVDGEVFG